LEEASTPRRAKPFFHRGWWCSNVGGTRTKLAQGREYKSAAEDALLDLLGEMRHRTDKGKAQETRPTAELAGMMESSKNADNDLRRRPGLVFQQPASPDYSSPSLCVQLPGGRSVACSGRGLPSE
jgi:hypothetical protein